MSLMGITIALVLAGQGPSELSTGALESVLRSQDPAALAREARRLGGSRPWRSGVLSTHADLHSVPRQRQRGSRTRSRPIRDG